MLALKRCVKPLPLAVVALATVMASALGDCSSAGGPATDGPLGSGVDGRIPHGANCVPGGQLQTFGDQQFTNHGHATVVLDRVALLHPHNERLIGSYAVPGAVLIGVVPWPRDTPACRPRGSTASPCMVSGWRRASRSTWYSA